MMLQTISRFKLSFIIVMLNSVIFFNYLLANLHKEAYIQSVWLGI